MPQTKQKKSSNQKMFKGMRKHFTEENIQIANKHMKTCAVISYQESEQRRCSTSIITANRVTYIDDIKLRTETGWRGSESLTHYWWK